ncbi:hypothetical protein NPIL_440211 [Nephila pilipes]|uniref:Uncharacterized protein n=1 Tax=Nephila pilipes TaxID=299642 RepID=A0A8X6R2B0_NEPPI|nr:hypothetical protein NPIL_440211 [Nephila pilipes]
MIVCMIKNKETDTKDINIFIETLKFWLQRKGYTFLLTPLKVGYKGNNPNELDLFRWNPPNFGKMVWIQHDSLPLWVSSQLSRSSLFSIINARPPRMALTSRPFLGCYRKVSPEVSFSDREGRESFPQVSG